MRKALLKFDSVGLAYKDKLGLLGKRNWVIKGLSLELYRGEVLGIVGNNGAGKSTLLRLLSDIIAPNEGSIWREHGIRSQLFTLNLGFNQNLDGIDNIILSLVTQGLTISQAKSKVDEVVNYADISHIIEHPIRTYSAGEKARLGFSIALQSMPDILLLDEILGVGDKNFRAKSSAALADIVKSDQTVVLVSHSANTIQQFCQRTLWLEKGKCIKLGETKKVLDAYLSSI